MRPAEPGDIEGIVAIDRETIGSKDAANSYRRELASEHARLQVLVEGGDAAGRIVGFSSYWRVADELQIITLAVAPERQRRGHGRRLLEHVLDVARAESVSRVTIEVRCSNAAAIGLYRGAGFETVGVRAKYYSPDGEDALVMNLDRLEGTVGAD